MILFDLVGGDESAPGYASLEASNGIRHYDFLKSIVQTAIDHDRKFLSQTILKALNFHAIACLHPNAGSYRPCAVEVGGNHNFPQHWQLPDLMDDFVNQVNRSWDTVNDTALAAFVLWRLNRIHPFINGNGRTARAACLFVLCAKAGGWFPFTPILPELIRQNRDEYVVILQSVDQSEATGSVDLQPLINFLERLIGQQIKDHIEQLPKVSKDQTDL